MARLWLFLFAALGVSAAETRWITHYTREGAGFQTRIDLLNSDFAAAQSVQLTPYAADGTALSHLVQTTTIAPGYRLALQRAELAWVGEPVAYVAVLAEAAVRVSAAYRAERDGAMSAQVQAGSLPSLQARYVPETDPNFFDGLVALNTSATPANLILRAHDAMGNTLRSTQIALLPGAKWLGVPAQLLEGLVDAQGYVSASADVPLLYLALRGSGPAIATPILTELALDTLTAEAAPLTYSNQISRIIERDCGACHHDSGIAPFSLQRFDDVHALRPYLHSAVRRGIMPPWKASDQCEPLSGSQAMDALEKEMLLDWLVGEGPEGEKGRAPAPVDYPDQWTFGPPDAEVAYSEDYSFQPGADVYRCFPIPLGNAEALRVRALEVLPGNPEIVHHVLIFIHEGDLASALDEAETGPGYTCFGGPGTEDIRLLAGWAPGSGAQVLPEDTTITLRPNTTLIMQVHYHYGMSAGTDRSRVGLYFTDEERTSEMLLLPLVNQDFLIPPGDANYLVTREVTIPFGISADLYGVMPHMHLLGKSIWVEGFFPDGEDRCLIDIPSWDFNWQRTYQFKQKLHLPTGTTLKLSCVFDNSEANPNNPHSPPQAVGWGDATTDEMALAFLAVVLPFNPFKQGERALLDQMRIEAGGHSRAHADVDALEAWRRGSGAANCCGTGKTRPWCLNPRSEL